MRLCLPQKRQSRNEVHFQVEPGNEIKGDKRDKERSLDVKLKTR
ncbi:hypothetical protein [Nostoc sp.]